MAKRKLLFVDDEPDFAQLVEQEFEDMIDEHEVSLIFAANGLEALQKLNEHPDIELVLADINMPVMDGLEFVSRAIKLDRLLKIIMVSAYGDMANLRKAMNRGAYDFIIKPVDFEDLTDTIVRTFKDIDQIKANEAELRRLQEIEKEMEIAKKILSSLLPTLLPSSFQSENFEVFGTLEAARTMTGSFYDFFPVTSHKLALVVGETEAKGIAAAIYIASAREAIRRFIGQNLDLSMCLKKINDYLFYQKTSQIPNIALFIGFFNTLTGELEYLSAGLPPQLITSQEGKISEQTTKDSYLGVSLDKAPIMNKIVLQKNESIIVRSQGIQKIKNKNNQIYPEKRLQELISIHHSQSPTALIEDIKRDVSQFVEPIQLTHDYIVLCLKFSGK